MSSIAWRFKHEMKAISRNCLSYLEGKAGGVSGVFTNFGLWQIVVGFVNGDRRVEFF